jgi:hypothetical protein
MLCSGLNSLDKALDLVPLPCVVAAVVAAFPPGALTVGHLDQPTFARLLIGQQFNNLGFAVGHLFGYLVQDACQRLGSGCSYHRNFALLQKHCKLEKHFRHSTP